MSEHRAHYLQHRDKNSPSRIWFYATCDCGWVGIRNTDGYLAAQSYAKHMGHTVPCTTCGQEVH